MINRIGLLSFLFGREWLPTRGSFGILPMMLTSFIMVAASAIMATPLGVGLAIFMVEYAPASVRVVLRTIIELLAGIPSVVYGFFGIVVLVPLMRQIFGGAGFGIPAATIVLAIMIMPTITAISADAIRAVAKENRLIIYSLGGTKWQTIYRGVLPSSVRGIMTSVILGLGRAIGETMAVLMVLGNAPLMPSRLDQPASALPSIIALDMAYASGDHRTALFAIGAVLLGFSSILIYLTGKVRVAKI